MRKEPRWLVTGALRAALPLLAGQAVVFTFGFAQRPALLWALPSPAEYAHFGVLNEVLQWGAAVGLVGLPTALLRLSAEKTDRRGDLLVTASVAVLATSVVTVALLLLVPGLLGALMGDPVAEEAFGVYGWRIPCIAITTLALASVHAAGLLKRKGAVQAIERVVLFVCVVGGAVAGGFEGLVYGSLVGSALAMLVGVVAAWRPARGDGARFDAQLLPGLLRIGGVQAGVLAFETFRRVVVLRVMIALGPGDTETGLLAAAMALTLPLIAFPEMVAQAVYPTMVDARGETEGVSRRHGRLLRELLVVAVPAFALYAAALWLALPWFKGGQYEGALLPCLVLLPGVIAHGVVAHTGYLVLVRHRLPRMLGVSIAALVVAAAGAWWGVPRFGATGAAGALTVALVVRAFLLVRIAR